MRAQKELEELKCEIERLRAENQELRHIVSALELGGTSEKYCADYQECDRMRDHRYREDRMRP